MVEALQPQAADARDGHGEDGAGDAPHGTPKGERHYDGQGVEVQAVRHKLGLDDIAEGVVDHKRDRRDHDNIQDRGVRLERDEGHRRQDGEEGADVGDEVQRKGDDAEDQHQLDLQQAEGKHHREGDDEAGNGLAEEVALHQSLHPRPGRAGMHRRQRRDENEEEKQERQEHGLNHAERGQRRVHDLAFVIPQHRPAEDLVQLYAQLRQEVAELLDLRAVRVFRPIEGHQGLRDAEDDPRQASEQQRDAQQD
mmetsp:Transcript_108713/g.313228  ORF Transcript_108713/g.313228 Transcript_108713/m.313228 type:complete len:252 (+) Transcript_108713:377-1132(+)